MKSSYRAIALLLGLSAQLAAQAQVPPAPDPPSAAKRPWQDRIWVGGSVGASFGDIDYVQLAPSVGVSVTPKISTGVGLSWVRRDYSGSPGLATNDYGVDLFARYRIVPQAFGQIQYSYTDYEFPLLGGGTADDSYSTVLVGGGWVQPLGGRASFVLSALYDVTYDEDERAPYDDPWVISAGVVFGF